MSEPSQQPDVSFVIAAYNAEETIAPAIQSALEQVSVSVEVVVVDDCSTDSSLEIVRSFDDPRVTVVRQPENGGPGKARNTGIAAATGHWIAVLDSDDTVLPERTAAMIARAEDMGAEVVVDNLEIVSMEGSPTYRMFDAGELAKRKTISLADYIGSNVIFSETFNFGYMKPMFSRAFLIEHGLGYGEDLRIGEDYIMMASALASGALCAIEPSAGYVYHLRQDSISRVLNLGHVDDMLRADQAFNGRFPLTGSALAAQLRRTRSLLDARAFLTLVDAIKTRSPGAAIGTAIANPSALRHLRMPITKRVQRVFARWSVNRNKPKPPKRMQEAG